MLSLHDSVIHGFLSWHLFSNYLHKYQMYLETNLISLDSVLKRVFLHFKEMYLIHMLGVYVKSKRAKLRTDDKWNVAPF